jgi:hypothetical protein
MVLKIASDPGKHVMHRDAGFGEHLGLADA